MLQIITDSTADLGDLLPERAQIKIVPLQVIIDGNTYKDGQDIKAKDLFGIIKKSGELPKTSAVALSDFSDVFTQSESSIYIGISSQLSCSVQNSKIASENCKNCVRIVDSLNLSTGIGILVLLAADLRDQGLSVDEIEKELRRQVANVRTSFIVDTLEYLHKGGRCSALQSIVGSILQIHPVISVRPDGTLGIKEKVHGNRAKSLKSLLDGIMRDLPILNKRRIFVTHAASPDDALYLSQELSRLVNPEEIIITEAGSVISSHCGPGTIGIIYMVNNSLSN